ncbi:MAG: alpha/beta fold hydrolase [Synechococcales bacterium]|nr:alpha/beta fold hydrolase [Synechococcales bacterium]
MTSLLTKTPFDLQTWQWQGNSIQFTALGSGQPLMLLHGFGASIGHWRNNIPALAAAGYRVYALDLLGFGGSDKPDRPYKMELWQELVEAFWQDNIGQPTVIVGNSIGGLLTLMLLAKAPGIAKGGILLNPAGGLNHRPEELNLPLRFVLGNFAKVVQLPGIGTWLFNRIRQKSNIRRSLRQVYCNSAAVTEELVELIYRPSCDPGAQQVFAAILRAEAGPHPTELLPHIHQPLLILWGEADPWTPITGAKCYQYYHDQVELISLPNTGHCPHDECPDRVNTLILDWLERQSF